MSLKSKKFISLFIIFSLMALSVNLYAKERRGAKLIITKKNGYQTEGELITVKPNSLLLLSITGRDVSVDIADIKVIRIAKKSNLLLGAWVGIAVGGGGGALLGSGADESGLNTTLLGGIIGGAAGLLVGALIGGVAGIDDTFRIERKPPAEIEKILAYLRKKARIRNYK